MGKPYLPFSEVKGDWSDQPLYIIGGGPSIKGFDFSKLEGRKLGANKSAWFADCDALCTLDQTFVRRCRQEIVDYINTGKDAFLVMPSTEDGHKPIDGATYIYRHRNQGLSDVSDRIYGTNSGYACLGLAYLMGAKEIALLGFDMKNSVYRDGSVDRTHWHESYQWHNHANHRYLSRWGNEFDKSAWQLKEAGACVVNFVGPNGSNLNAFPKRPLEDLF